MDRQKYMKMLDLQAKNNKTNYEANKIFRNQIQTPMNMHDNRTISEKLSDINQLKVNLNKDLFPLLDGIQCNIAIGLMTIDEIIFVSQQCPYIIKQLVSKYSLGMLGTQFVSYIRNLKKRNDLTLGVDYGIQEDHSIQLLSSLNEKKISKDESTELNKDHIRNARLQFFEKTEKKVDIRQIEIQQVKDNLSNWFKKYNHGLLYGIKTGFGSGWNNYTYDGCLSEFIDHALPGIESSLKRYYTRNVIDDYILELQKILEIKDKPLVYHNDDTFILFRNAISTWYSCHKINFGNSIWDSILQYHFQYINENRFLRSEHIIQLVEFIQCIIDILQILK